MSKEIVEIKKLEKPVVPKSWSYDESLSKVKANLYKWKNLTIEMASELYIAREALSRGKPRKDTPVGRKRSNETKVSLVRKHTWTAYCKKLGSNKDTVNKWLKQFFEKPELAKSEKRALESTIREKKVKCFSKHYSSKDSTWGQSCGNCLCKTLCRNLGRIVDEDSRFKSNDKEGKS